MSETHPVLRYLEKAKISQEEFSAACDLSAGLISGFVNWKVVPGRNAAEAIVREAGGLTSSQLRLNTRPIFRTGRRVLQGSLGTSSRW